MSRWPGLYHKPDLSPSDPYSELSMWGTTVGGKGVTLF